MKMKCMGRGAGGEGGPPTFCGQNLRSIKKLFEFTVDDLNFRATFPSSSSGLT